MILEILTNQISESSAAIVAACILLSVGAMIFDSLFEHRITSKQASKRSPEHTWHNGSDGIDPCGVPFKGLEPMTEDMNQVVSPIVTPDGVPCLNDDPYIDLTISRSKSIKDNEHAAVTTHAAAKHAAVTKHGLA